MGSGCSGRYLYTNRQKNKQTNRQTKRQTNKQTNKQANKINQPTYKAVWQAMCTPRSGRLQTCFLSCPAAIGGMLPSLCILLPALFFKRLHGLVHVKERLAFMMELYASCDQSTITTSCLCFRSHSRFTFLGFGD